MEDLLKSISDKLTELAELKHIDENFGQLMNYGIDIPVKWPCALLHILNAQFSDLAYDYRNDESKQMGNLSIEITIANLKLSKTSTGAPASQRQKGFEIYTTIKKVHELLHGWKPLPNSGALKRTSFQSIIRDDGVQEKRIIYTIGLNGC